MNVHERQKFLERTIGAFEEEAYTYSFILVLVLRDKSPGLLPICGTNSITFELFPGLCKTLHMIFRPNNSTGWAIFSEHFNRWQIVLWLVLDRPGEKARGKFKRYRICSIYR